MRKKSLKQLLTGVFLLTITVLLSSCSKMIVLQSKGPIGQKETELIYLSFALMLIVVIPVFIMVFLFSVRYRASNKKATYAPKWADSRKIEWVIWIVPILIILVLSYLTWVKTKELDPYKPIASEIPALKVDVVSLDWKWLFIYPDDSVATINELVIEAGRPVSFRLTSATVMTSFFIPQLGSQMYAMAGMQTQLNLLADHPGNYIGHNMEFSGEGYDLMSFNVTAKTPEEFKEWLKQAKLSPVKLSEEKYAEISKSHMGYPVTVYSSADPDLFNKIMAPFMDWMTNCDMKMSSCCHKDKLKCCEESDSIKTHQCCEEEDSMKTECCMEKDSMKTHQSCHKKDSEATIKKD